MRGGEGTSFSIRTGAFAATLFVGVGIYLPFFPLWLLGRGLSGSEIAMVLAAPLFVRIAVAPLLTALAERLPDLRVASALYAALAAIALIALGIATGFWLVLALWTVAYIFWNILPPLLDATILAGVRQHGIDYARVRMWGSVGFIAASLGGAMVLEGASIDAVFWALCGCFVAGIGLAMTLPRVAAPSRSAERLGFKRALADPVLRRSFLAGGLVLGSNGVYYTFGSIFWTAHGFSEGIIGALWAFSVVGEVVLFWAAKLLPGWGARRFLLAAAVGALVRWSLFPLATVPATAFALQALHSLTFAGAHLGLMMAIGAVSASGHSARLQGVNQVVSGLALAVATLAAGPLYRVSPFVAFGAMAALALPAVALSFGLPRGLQPQRAEVGGSTSAPA